MDYLRHRPSLALLILVTIVMAGCGPHHPPADPAYLAEIEEWHSARVERLKAEDGWLSLVGLHWLEPGVNTLGADPANTVVVPDGSAPDFAAEVILDPDGATSIRAIEGVSMTVNDTVCAEASLRSDAEGAPDIVEIGRLGFYVITRDGRAALRIKDPEAPTRTSFEGIQRFPVDPAFRVEARFEVFENAKTTTIATAIGTQEEMNVPGLLHFTIDGNQLTLEPFADSADEPLFIVFRDQTSGTSTYGAGRFMSAEAPVDGTVILDFNRATNPPCAFTPYATCPLPPAANQLDIAITAGEKYDGHH